MEAVERPYDAAAAELGMSVADFLAHLERMVERKLLRRVAAILYHRRAGFSANGMGVWKVPDEEIVEVGARMASVRGVSHCYERPTYADWPYSVFTMAHGRSKEECDAILQSIADEHELHGDDRGDPLLLDRVQEDPPALLHGRVRGVGARQRLSRGAPYGQLTGAGSSPESNTAASSAPTPQSISVSALPSRALRKSSPELPNSESRPPLPNSRSAVDAAVEDVVALAAVQDVVAAQPVELVVALAAGQDVGAGTPVEDVVGVVSVQAVVAGVAVSGRRSRRLP